MQVAPHVYAAHIDDKAATHPGGSNIFFVGDPKEEMVIVDAGDQALEWREEIFKAYEELGVSHLMLGFGAATLEGTMDRMERFATDVKPLAA